MTLNELSEKIKKDLKIDKFKITDEACNNAVLFGEYKAMYHSENRNLFKLERALDTLIESKTNFYKGNGKPEEYKEKSFDIRIKSNALLDKYLNADADIQKMKEAIFNQRQKVDFLKDTCDYIKAGRGYAIKTALDNIRFENGA